MGCATIGPLCPCLACLLLACLGPGQTRNIPGVCLQAHCQVVAGACLAVGIRYAGSCNAPAQALLRKYLLYFVNAKQGVPEPGAGGQTIPQQATNLQLLLLDRFLIDAGGSRL